MLNWMKKFPIQRNIFGELLGVNLSCQMCEKLLLDAFSSRMKLDHLELTIHLSISQFKLDFFSRTCYSKFGMRQVFPQCACLIRPLPYKETAVLELMSDSGDRACRDPHDPWRSHTAKAIAPIDLHAHEFLLSLLQAASFIRRAAPFNRPVISVNDLGISYPQSNMADVKDITPELDRLDSQLDDLEDALEPLLGNLEGISSQLPLLDKAKLFSLTAYAIESLLFCKSLHY